LVGVADFDAGGTNGEGEGCDPHAIWFAAAGVSGLCAVAMCDCGIAAGEGFSAAAFEVSRFDCGRSEIGQVFSRFQKYLYQQVA
jgi:hypothetical protein